MNVYLGAKVRRKSLKVDGMDPQTGKAISKLIRGRVVYIHPKGRFHVVEYDLAFGAKLREAFAGVGM